MSNDQAIGPGIDLDGISKDEPEVRPEDARPFENAALIGGEKLQSSGYFVNIVKVGSTKPIEGTPSVLIVEDDPGTSAVIDAVLSSKGYSTRVAANLNEIKRALSKKPYPHLILLDIMLPDANGFAVLERIRRHPDLAPTPVIMLTNLSDPADVAKGLALGATGYMSKPASPGALLAAIDNVLGTSSTN